VFDRLAAFILRHRLPTALLLAGAVAAVSAGTTTLVADFSIQAFFGSDDPALTRLEAFQERWGPDDSMMLVTIETEPGELVTPARMIVVAELTEALEASAGVASVRSLANTPRMHSQLPGMLDLTPLSELIPEPGATPEELQRWRRELREHPHAIPHLLARDGGAAAIAIELAVSSDDIAAMRPVVAALRSVVAGFDGREGLRLRTAGVPAVRADFFEVIFRDQFIMLPVIAVLLLSLLIGLFRRTHAVIAPVLAAVIPTVMVFGAMGLCGEPVGILNQSYFTLLPVIAVADAIHMVSRFHEELRRRAPDGQALTAHVRDAAIRKAVSRVGLACLLTSTTTAVGFLSLRAADMTVLQSFGLYAALGIVLAYATVLLVVPLVLSFARRPPPRSGPGSQYNRLDRVLLGCAELSVGRPKLVLAVTAVFMVLSLWMGTRVVVDNNLTTMLEDDHPTSVANRVVDERLGGILGTEIEIEGEPQALKDPALLRALLELESWALQHELARSASSPASVVASLQQALTGTREIPSSRAEVAQLLLLAESLPDLGEIVDLSDFSRGRMVIRSQDPGANEYLAFGEQIRDRLALTMEPLAATAHITGTPWVAYRGINNVTLDLRNSLSIAFLAVALIILVLLRSPRLALLCLLPNALPLVAGYGLMGLCGWLLDPTPAVVFTVALGIAVDDTIHMMVRYREEYARDGDHEAAIRRAVLHTGRPVVLTSILLCTGFLVNVLSSFPTMVVLGMLGAFVIAVAMLCDLFVLPALLALFGQPRGEAP
jgi:predicted RND superfamily exporter protein